MLRVRDPFIRVAGPRNATGQMTPRDIVPRNPTGATIYRAGRARHAPPLLYA